MPQLAEKFISDNGANIYDKVKITNKEQTLEGIIMPRNNFSGGHIIVLKLDNGYNIGVSTEDAEISIIEKAKEKQKKKLRFLQISQKNIQIHFIYLSRRAGRISKI